MKYLITIITLLYLFFPVSGIAGEQRVELKIDKMTCSLCTIAVKKSLSNIKGIKNIKVSFKDKKAWFIVDDSITDEVLKSAVKKVGYEVRAINRK